MATISAVILKHHKKQDGTYNVKIRITHRGSTVYIDTSIYATRSDLDTKVRLKKVFIDSFLTSTVNEYRSKVNLLGAKVEYMTASDIKNILNEDIGIIDIIKFWEKHIEDLHSEKRTNTAVGRNTTLNRFKEFCGRSVFPIELLTSKKIREYIDHLTKKQYAPLTLINSLSDLRLVFNLAKDHYNDEELGLIRIPTSPFSKIKMPVKNEPVKKNLSIDTIKKIRDLELVNEGDILSRDLFMLSFYLCGINANDLHEYLNDPHIERLGYTRNKTKGRRVDKAFISIKIIEEAKPLVEKYAGVLAKRYARCAGLNNRLYLSYSKVIGPAVGVPDLTYYHARHSFATLARNECRFSMDDVGIALNHKSSTITDIYVAKDWDIVDEVQEAVVSLLR
ncbi:phage integrase SAM-like domain-containing protein [Sphingobacterium sp. UT-1RO-CII-1]|uniref:tyrosine-type recombinase/integrase n=1 Tax=Sphingobacterium sp. UT-1RO-CII-1 TaxID=2995225 RepID=UPI00227B258B|nr:phage integrase SAM-like domain-containing protein [Sphingobacterium sp. UT-1RO-CII-1]MCY4781412.1 phage integrase SAM-like domain-containing protein [Sphingobacterium sp. UT-1RO-CII-1]